MAAALTAAGCKSSPEAKPAAKKAADNPTVIVAASPRPARPAPIIRPGSHAEPGATAASGPTGSAAQAGSGEAATGGGSSGGGGGAPGGASTAAAQTASMTPPQPAASPAPVPAPAAATVVARTDTMVIGRVDAVKRVEPKDSESADPIAGVIPQLPASVEMKDPGALFKLPDDQTLRKQLVALRGTWRQVGGGSASDFTEGGYAGSELTFSDTGSLRIVRVFGEQRVLRLVRQIDYNVKAENVLTLGEHTRPEASSLIQKELRVGQDNGTPIVITPAASTLPASLTFKLSESRLELAGKTYERAKD